MSENNKFLHNAIKGNSIFSFLSGLSMIIWNEGLSEIFGVAMPLIFSVIGTVLLLFSISLFLIARMNKIPGYLAWLIIVLDIGWVAGSVLLIGLEYLTPEGNLWTGVVGAIVLFIAILQIIGVKKTSGKGVMI